MKNPGVLFFLLMVSFAASGQKTEFSVAVGSGLFNYQGSGTSGHSSVVYGIITPHAYALTPYGTKPDFPVSAEIQVLRQNKFHLLFGLDIGYQSLNTRIPVTTGVDNPEVIRIGGNYNFEASGKTYLKNQYVSLHPVFGKRLKMKELTLDVLAGCDFAFGLSSREIDNASVPTTHTIIDLNFNKSIPVVDYRPTIQLQISKKRSGIQMGYSLGLTNYQSPGNGKAYTRFLSIGYRYRIL